MMYIGITLGIIVLLALFTIGSYNNLVKQKAMVDEGWSGIDVQLKRRYDLVPNLVETVKGYMHHEQGLLERVTKARAQAMQAQTVDQKAEAEKGLTGALKTLFAVSESYPDLKANQNFLSLQKELSILENEIQLARRYYNGTARNYNIAVRSFPSNLIAQLFTFEPASYFEISDDEKKNPKITF